MSVKSKMETTGDLRTFLAGLAVAVVHGDTKPQEAAIAIKACKEINSSLYSEIKAATIQVELGRTPSALGELPLSK